jgi:hypothetical protein
MDAEKIFAALAEIDPDDELGAMEAGIAKHAVGRAEYIEKRRQIRATMKAQIEETGDAPDSLVDYDETIARWHAEFEEAAAREVAERDRIRNGIEKKLAPLVTKARREAMQSIIAAIGQIESAKAVLDQTATACHRRRIPLPPAVAYKPNLPSLADARRRIEEALDPSLRAAAPPAPQPKPAGPRPLSRAQKLFQPFLSAGVRI